MPIQAAHAGLGIALAPAFLIRAQLAGRHARTTARRARRCRRAGPLPVLRAEAAGNERVAAAAARMEARRVRAGVARCALFRACARAADAACAGIRRMRAPLGFCARRA
ncbi:glycine cleavage system transcriptional activator (Gcv operon activator)(GcvA), LysR family domain [Burkholderia thailandensis]|uniref:Glycine cleavage system transcriptional activator (Gcv operon activator)(GcvA), LysR family domain n=1 Tax=Burkholderia thailandensis TaxID=57975 RepID=A0AAW9CJR9_BURTH|nr:glycine cleavage system transcriptional activator (Gcv operon activator)(GcvA), LysR family domain [Burkholderia thailandensis]MDW9251230.1 glycine cleavage system transcriptional activator (Gcv operon activator)(GcvA), LysR family domain [Burkholderia thailandensis]